MSIFRFKKFDVVNERSAMKVNTDGVLLGAAMTLTPQDRRLLDIGTGTGTIALMAAQRLGDMGERYFAASQDDNPNLQDDSLNIRNDSPNVQTAGVTVIPGEAKNPYAIDAIDIDGPSATEAAANFANSPWASCLHSHNMSLDDFSNACPEAKYDLIFSNPPYFEETLMAPDERRSAARHALDGLSYRDIFEFASGRLTENGRVSLVLPADQENDVARYARMCGLHMFRILRIRTVPRKNPVRIVVEFSRRRVTEVQDGTLTIQSEGKYTQEYLSLTHDFYLFA